MLALILHSFDKYLWGLGVGFSDSSSPIPAGHPTIQFNSDVICPDSGSDSTGLGLSPTEVPTSDASHKWGPQAPHTLPGQLQIQRFPQSPSWVQFTRTTHRTLGLEELLKLVERLPSKCEALGSNCCTTKGGGLGKNNYKFLLKDKLRNSK
jgi:hypothetical protein